MSVNYSQMSLRDLKEVAKAHGVKDYKTMEKEYLVELLTSTLKSPEKMLKSKKSVTTLLAKENFSSESKKSLPPVDPKILQTLQSEVLPPAPESSPKKRGRKPKVKTSESFIVPKKIKEEILKEENVLIPKTKEIVKKTKEIPKKSKEIPKKSNENSIKKKEITKKSNEILIKKKELPPPENEISLPVKEEKEIACEPQPVKKPRKKTKKSKKSKKKIPEPVSNQSKSFASLFLTEEKTSTINIRFPQKTKK